MRFVASMNELPLPVNVEGKLYKTGIILFITTLVQTGNKKDRKHEKLLFIGMGTLENVLFLGLY